MLGTVFRCATNTIDRVYIGILAMAIVESLSSTRWSCSSSLLAFQRCSNVANDSGLGAVYFDSVAAHRVDDISEALECLEPVSPTVIQP